MPNAKARVWCRDCGNEMKNYLGLLTFYCSKCKLKVDIRYEDTPIIKAI